MTVEHQIELVIGAGGASVMDCVKLIAFGARHEADWWEHIEGKDPYGLERLSLGKELTAYTGLVTLVQLSASMLGDQNPISYDAGISVIRNVQTAARRLMESG